MSTLLLTVMMLSAAPEKWVTVDEPAFIAEFPKMPAKGELPDDPGTVVHQASLKLADGRVWELVLSVSTPPENVRSKARELTAEQLRQVQMELLAPEDFTLLDETESSVEFGKKALPVRDFTARNPKGRKMSGRVLTYKGRLFQILTFHPVAKPLDAEHERFVSSVRFK